MQFGSFTSQRCLPSLPGKQSRLNIIYYVSKRNQYIVSLQYSFQIPSPLRRLKCYNVSGVDVMKKHKYRPGSRKNSKLKRHAKCFRSSTFSTCYTVRNHQSLRPAR